MQRIVDAGGQLTIEQDSPEESNRLQSMLNAAVRHQLVPDGMRLYCRGTRYSKIIDLRLVDADIADEWFRGEREQVQRRTTEHRERRRAGALKLATDEQRARILVERATAWAEEAQIRTYLADMAGLLSGLHGQQRGEAEAWLAWASTWLAEQDHFSSYLSLPPDPREIDIDRMYWRLPREPHDSSREWCPAG